MKDRGPKTGDGERIAYSWKV